MNAETCNKTPIKNHSVAKHVARDMSEKYREKMLAYRCKVCGEWHVGHPPKRVIKHKARREGRQSRDRFDVV